MILVIDNYDSFTFNLFHYLGSLGADVVVHRNDKISADDVIAEEPDAIVLSPGPCTPNEAGICLDLIAKASPTIPILGVCLGHQAIAQAFAAAHPDFEMLDAGHLLEQLKVEGALGLCSGGASGHGYLRLWPHLHHTDGFFAAIWTKKA